MSPPCCVVSEKPCREEAPWYGNANNGSWPQKGARGTRIRQQQLWLYFLRILHLFAARNDALFVAVLSVLRVSVVNNWG
jgi:hypothetical protein